MLHWIIGLILLVAPVPLEHLEADFIQLKTVQLLQEQQRSEGHLTYRAPAYLRWEYTTPVPMVWETGGNDGQTNRQAEQIVQLIMRSVNGEYLTDNEDFIVERMDNVACLTPKKRELRQLFRTIRIRLNQETGIADEVELTEKNGDRTLITFHNVNR